MPSCAECGKSTTMPYECKYCGHQFCSEHRLPENHDCHGLEEYKEGMRSEGKIFETYEEPDKKESLSGRVKSLVPFDFRGNVALALVAAMIVVYILQMVVLVLGGSDLHNLLFVLGPRGEVPSKPWTVLTSVLSHSPVSPYHLIVNAMVLFFFGPTLERLIGSDSFFKLFWLSGVVAGLGFILTVGGRVVGASGAIFAVMGALTVLRPNLRVYIYFLIPMPLWLLTVLYGAFTIVMVPSMGAGGVADLAHLIGLVIGLAWGYRAKGRIPERRGGGGLQGPLGGGRRRRRP